MPIRKSLVSQFAPLSAIAAVVAASLLSSSAAKASPPAVSAGSYVDSSGTKQAWHVDGAHRLIWDDKPFVPVGGLFQARSWAPDATDDDWKSDKAALAVLKAHNVTDIYLQPARGFGLTDVPPAAIQRMIDSLDADGFTYGISIVDGPRGTLAGYVVRPGAYRQEVVDGADSVRFPASDFTSFLYIVASVGEHREYEVLSTGSGLPSDGKAVVPMPTQVGQLGALGAKIVGIVVPQKEYRHADQREASQSVVRYPDLWGGFDDYRDRLLSLFRGIRLGTGFRFFVDPLPPDLSLAGSESEHLVPTGIGFTTEWGAYLSRKYKKLPDLELAWDVSDHDAKDIDEAARFVPLWSNESGVADFYDRDTRKLIGVQNPGRSRFWDDLGHFKADSIQRYMNDLALSLKRAVADVPVVYRSSGHSALFDNLTSDEGFDGIGIDAYGRGVELIENSGGYVYSEALDAQRALWLLVTATSDAPPAEKTAPGYASKLSMQSDFDYLREIGARGFYVDSLQSASGNSATRDFSTIPDQLDWLAGYQHMLVATGVRGADTIPDTMVYPEGLPGGGVRVAGINKPIMIPTKRPSVAYDFGAAGRAYALSENGGTVYYLYNPTGSRSVHVKIPRAFSKAPGAAQVEWLPHAAGEMQHNNVLSLTIGPEPVRILNLASIPVPTEAVPALRDEAASLVTLMKKRNIGEAGRFQIEVDEVKGHANGEQPINDVLSLQDLIKQMQRLLRPYAWIEAEDAVGQSFDEKSDRAGASGGKVLVVEPRQAGGPAAIATYGVDVREDALYEIWVAASPNAPLTFRLDGAAMLDHASVPEKLGAPYAEGTLVWQKYGTATLPRGSHTLEVRASGPAALDVILLIKPNQFRPDGPNPPPVE